LRQLLKRSSNTTQGLLDRQTLMWAESVTSLNNSPISS
jgi:hypothetical protein